MKNDFYIYIMANERNGTLYIGVTSSLVKRVHEHKSKLVEGFSKRYGLDKLVYFEPIKSQEEAFLREKRLKTWKRNWKLELIEKGNPEWKDLYSDLI